MTGHYPPICYPSNGEPLLGSRLFHLKVGDIMVDGTEYQFKARADQGCDRKSVYNFFVVPGQENFGIVPDIKGVQRAARDYQRRYFGAAQFQVVLDADQPVEVRDEVFTTLIGSDAGLLKTLGIAK
jgi:F420-0:gamma-glutamyl ligase-like protein